MDFLKDPRFSEYRSTTSITKYFPKHHLDTSSPKSNFIYKLIKSTEPTIHQQHSAIKQKHQNQQKQRHSTLDITNKRFLVHKTSQRLQTIKSFFEHKKNLNSSTNAKASAKGRAEMKKQILNLSQFTVDIQQFQKQIKDQKQRIHLLKNYNNLINSHFQRFQVNEDRTRNQILDHQEIIRLLSIKNTEDENVAYFNAIGDKKLKKGIKNRAKSSIDVGDLQQKINSEIIAEMSQVKDYQVKCEQKVSQAIEELKKSQCLKNVNFSRVHTEKGSIKSDSFKHSQFKENSRVGKQKLKIGLFNKQNIWQSSGWSGKDGTIKKSGVKKMREPIFNRERNTFVSMSDAKCVLNRTCIPLKQSSGLEKGKVRMQKRVNTVGPLEECDNYRKEENGSM